MTGVEAAPTLDLSALVERLRLSGFRIDTRQYLTAHELLLALATSGVELENDPRRVVSHLGPIFCTSVHEQYLFADEVRHWFGQESVEGTGDDGQDKGRGKGSTTRSFWRRHRLELAAVAVIAALLIGGTWYYVENIARVTVEGTVVLELADGRFEPRQANVYWDGFPVSVDSNGRFVISARRSQLRTQLTGLLVDDARLPYASFETLLDGRTVQIVMRTPSLPTSVSTLSARRVAVALPATRTETRVIPWLAVAVSALALAGIVWGILWGVERARRELAIRRLPVHDEPDLVTLRVPDPQVLPVSETQLRRAAIALRRRRDEALVDLDVVATIGATVRAAGFFVPRYSSRRATPEYLAIVSRRGEQDHQARTFDSILDHLAELGVALDRYSFHDDPRFVYSETTARGNRLAEVVSRHHRATLLVCAESAAGFRHSTGHVANWVDATRPLVRRIYLTPESPYRWTRAEFALIEAGFIVLPATERGWMALADLALGGRLDSFAEAPYTRAFPAVLGTNELRWLDRNEPPSEIAQKLIRQLKEFLGPEGFSWLCACAVYPEITWPLTLRVAHEPPDYSLLPSLARLPWFRHGFMPDWLRQVLIDMLPPESERRLRATLERLLEDLAHHATKGRRPGGGGLDIVGAPRDLLLVASPGSPLRDQVFIGFMFGARPDRLWLRAPEMLARVFRRGVGRFVPARSEMSPRVRSFRERLLARCRWWMVFRPRMFRLAVAFAAGLVAFAGLPTVMTRARVSTGQESIWFLEVPGGEFIMGSDKKVDTAAETNEQPQHLLFVPTFFIAATPVTVAQYSVCVNEGSCSPGDERALQGPADWPVRYVSWSEALDYCRWLENGLKTWKGTPDLIAGVLSGRIGGRQWHVTLPSEPEWEKAARGSDARIYPWGNSQEPVRVTRLQAWPMGTPSPVGRIQSEASPYGVLDMSGNVAEWTRSLERPYPYSSVDGRESLDLTQSGVGARVIRSGASGSDSAPNVNGEVRAARRRPSSQTRRDASIGFRVAISSLEAVSPSAPELTLARKTPSPAVPPRNTVPSKPTATSPKVPPAAKPAPSAKPSVTSPAPAATSPPPAATSPPPAATTSPAIDVERAGILRALNRYQDAYRGMNVKALEAVYPSLPRETRQRLERQFRDCRAYDVTFGNLQVALASDATAATVSVRTTYLCQPRTAQSAAAQTVENVFILRKVGGEWLIDRTGQIDSAPGE